MIRLDGTSVGGSSGGLSGTIAATQIAYGSGTNTIAGNASLVRDATSGGLQFNALPIVFGIADDTNNSEPAVVVRPNSGNEVSLLLTTTYTDTNTWTGAWINVSENAGTPSVIIQPQVNGSTSGDLQLAASGGSGGIRLQSSLIQVGGDITFTSSGKAIRPDSTDAHTMLFQVYDNDTGPAYVTWATITNGNTPSVVIAPPAGGTTISVQATTYKSSDGSTGGTGTVNTASTPSIVFKNGLFISAS